MADINLHIGNLAAQANKAINEYARLEMCRIKNIFVSDTGHLGYLQPPDELEKEIKLQKAKVTMLLDEIAQAVEERDNAKIEDDE